jgi:hypothetical protein
MYEGGFQVRDKGAAPSIVCIVWYPWPEAEENLIGFLLGQTTITLISTRLFLPSPPLPLCVHYNI